MRITATNISTKVIATVDIVIAGIVFVCLFGIRGGSAHRSVQVIVIRGITCCTECKQYWPIAHAARRSALTKSLKTRFNLSCSSSETVAPAMSHFTTQACAQANRSLICTMAVQFRCLSHLAKKVRPWNVTLMCPMVSPPPEGRILLFGSNSKPRAAQTR